MITDKPEVWMIAISDNSISMHYRNLVIDSWISKGYKVNHFEAITPADLNQHDILKFKMKNSARLKRKVEFTETEKAVWYSHFFAWRLCYESKKPIIVAEHDINLLKEIDCEVYEHPIACLTHVTTKHGKIAKLAGGSYFITPAGARHLMTIKNKPEIVNNSDAWIHNRCDNFGKWFHLHSTQIKDDNIGVTVEHN